MTYKNLDQESYDLCQKLIQKKSQAAIAKKLNALGYRNKRGNRISQGNVSVHLRTWPQDTATTAPDAFGTSSVLVENPLEVLKGDIPCFARTPQDQEIALKNVRALIDSNLSLTNKYRFVLQLLTSK